MSKGVDNRLAERPLVEFWRRCSEETVFEFPFGIPSLEHIAQFVDGIKKRLIEVLIDAHVCSRKHLEYCPVSGDGAAYGFDFAGK